MILTQIGYVTAYIVLLKTLLPSTLESMLHIQLPSVISGGIIGQTVWAFVFSFCVILPLSLPRKLSAAKYSSIICLGLMSYFVCTIVGVCLFNRAIVPDLSRSL